jgi:hypothetical protein
MQLNKRDALLKGLPLHRLNKRLDKEVSPHTVIVWDPVLAALGRYIGSLSFSST